MPSFRSMRPSLGSLQDAIEKMLAALPMKITVLEQIEALPWGGNAAWDVPIMLHLDRVVFLNKSLPEEFRRKAHSLACFLMTGEGSRGELLSEASFREYIRQAENIRDEHMAPRNP